MDQRPWIVIQHMIIADHNKHLTKSRPMLQDRANMQKINMIMSRLPNVMIKDHPKFHASTGKSKSRDEKLSQPKETTAIFT